MGQTALFGARFRENAARALLIPRRRPGERTPLWQQRLKAQSLLQVARKYRGVPDRARDLPRVPAGRLRPAGAKRLLHGLRTRELDLVDVETPSASPYAASLLFDYVATYMYEDDTPPAERRAQALSLDRDLLRELLGQEELRDLIDADALARRRAAQLRGRPANADELHDVLRLRGDLRLGRVRRGASPRRSLRERRAIRVRGRGRRAPDRGRGRRPLPRRARRRCRRAGCPTRSSRAGPEPLRQLVARYARRPRPVHDRRGERARFGRDVEPVLARARARGEARPRRAAARRDRARVVRSRRPAPAAPRVARRAAQGGRAGRAGGARRASCRAGTASTAARRCARRSSRCRGCALPVSLWESEVLPRRVPGYRPEQLDQLCATGELVWVGAGLDRVAALLPRGRAGARPAAAARRRPRARRTTRSARRSAGAPSSGSTCSRATGLEAEAALPALWDLVWAGEVTNDAWTPLRAGRRYGAPRPERAAAPLLAPPRARRSPRRRAAGRSPTRLFAGDARPPRARRAPARAAGDRHARRRARRGHPRRLRRRLRRAARRSRRSASAGAATSSRASAARSSRSAAPSSGCASCGRARARSPSRSCSPPPIPAQPYGAALPWPKRAGARAARVAGAHVVLLGGEAALFVERGGRSLVPLREPDPEWLRPALAALVEHARRVRREAPRGRALRRRAGRRDGRDAAARRGRLPRRPAPRRAAARRCPRATRSTARRAGSRRSSASGSRSRRRIRARPRARSPSGSTARSSSRVAAVGKNVLLEFEGGLVLRSHLRMSGRWRVEPGGTGASGGPGSSCAARSSEAVLWNGPVLALGDARHAPPRAGHPRRPARPRGDASRSSAPSAAPRARRRPARPAARGRDRERLESGVALARAGLAVAPRRRHDRRGATRDLGHAAALMRESRRRRPAGAPRLPQRRAPVPALRRADRSRGQGDDNRTAYWCAGCQR